MRINRLQINVATGRMTLPVAILFCLMIWVMSLDSWKDLGTLGITVLTGYLMIETNTAFSLIRTRTSLPVSIYWCLFSALVFLHTFEWNCFTPLAFLLAVVHLYRSYESPYASANIFHAFFFLSLGSLAFPQLLFFAPIFLFSTFNFRSLSPKSFFAGLLGIATPYWLLFGYAYWNDDMPLVLTPLQELFHFQAIEYSLIPLYRWISWGFVSLLFIITGIHYSQVSYQDKTRTRIYMTFLIVTGCWATLITLLQPQHLHPLLPVQLICTSFLAAHLFTLTRNRFSSIFFIVTFVGSIFLTGYNLWMQFFNF